MRIQLVYMNSFFRVCFLSLLFASMACSCQPTDTIVPPASSSTVAPVPQAAGETPSHTAIPGQPDLVFIEFFAGT